MVGKLLVWVKIYFLQKFLTGNKKNVEFYVVLKTVGIVAIKFLGKKVSYRNIVSIVYIIKVENCIFPHAYFRMHFLQDFHWFSSMKF